MSDRFPRDRNAGIGEESTAGRSRPALCLLASLLLLAFFTQAVTSATPKSPTFDEEFHVARAYAYTTAGDLRMQQNHPPLVSALTALPLLLLPELTRPGQIAGWDEPFLFTFADELFWRLGHDVDKMLFLARFPIILLGTLLGAFVYRWALEMFGPGAALAATALYAFSPNLLAHTRLVTTDLAVAAFTFIAFYAFWRYLRRPSWLRLALGGLAAGLALSAKLSALLILPLFVFLALLDGWRGAGSTERRARLFLSILGRCVLVFAIAGVVVWAFYGFEVRPWPGTGLPLPATTYLLNVLTLLGHAERGHGAFLIGQVSMHGWWYYFPVTLLLKTPLVMLALLVVALWDTVRRKRWLDEAPVLLFPIVYFISTLTSPLNIGYRYILPLAPFLCLYAGKVASLPWLRPHWIRSRLLPALMALYAASALWLHPHYLAYFNLLAGGPGGGYRFVVDSSLDWGQDLKLLNAFLEEQGVDDVWLGYFGTADPAYYGIRYRPIFPTGSSKTAADFAPLNPAPGWYAISATVLQGPFSAEADALDWFRRREPVEKIGYSIFVYHVEPDEDPPRWVSVCYGPEPALDDREVLRRFGRDDLRLIGFDCGQTWVVPAGDLPGWYLVPLALDGRGTLAAEWLGEAEVVFRERGLRGGPAYTVYRWRRQGETGAEGMVQEAWASPVLAPDGDDVQATLFVPADFGGEAAFLGYRLSAETAAPGDELNLTTAWRVIARPADPALSMFAHLVGPDGPMSVGDCLGFPAIQWAPGDVFHQRSRLPVPADAPAGTYWAQVGLYSLATGDRLPVLEGEAPVADRVLLGPIRAVDDG